MLDKIKSYPYKALAAQFKDVRNLGLLAFLAIVLLVSWSGLKVIQTNYELEQQISKLQQEVDVGQLENNNLKLSNQYYNTDEFLELAARRQFGKAAPGETLLVVPKTVALAHTVDISGASASGQTPKIEQSRTRQNFQSWLDFFFHHGGITE